MKRAVTLMGVAILFACVVIAEPWAQTYEPGGMTFAITNDQVNSVWAPVAVLWKFAPATNATLTVTRISQGNSYELAALAVTNARTVIWVAEAQYPFEHGDVLQVSSSVTNSAVQVIRKGK